MSKCKGYDNVTDWLRDYEDKIFRMWTDKDSICDFVKIREAITLPDGSVLLGVQYIYYDGDLNLADNDCDLSYYKLDEISLSYLKNDNED